MHREQVLPAVVLCNYRITRTARKGYQLFLIYYKKATRVRVFDTTGLPESQDNSPQMSEIIQFGKLNIIKPLNVKLFV
jgi:hypothetical protein